MNKLEAIKQLIAERFQGADISVAQSFQSGRQMLISAAPDVVILDMQLPTFDKSVSEEGGRRRPLAGKELLRQIQRRNIATWAIVVTQFQEFGDDTHSISLQQLQMELDHMGVKNYAGLVYYSSRISAWRDELAGMIKRVRTN